jgi:hypothetical protein
MCSKRNLSALRLLLILPGYPMDCAARSDSNAESLRANQAMRDHTLESDDAAEIDVIFAATSRAALRAPRAMLVGIILGWSLAQFDVSTGQASAAGLAFCILNIGGLGLRRLPQIALTCFAIAVVLWLHIPVVERVCSAIDRLLAASGA